MTFLLSQFVTTIDFARVTNFKFKTTFPQILPLDAYLDESKDLGRYSINWKFCSWRLGPSSVWPEIFGERPNCFKK
jgi:hypothetical protein